MKKKKFMKKLKKKNNGFELLKNIKIPKIFHNPKKEVSNLSNIWKNDILNDVRENHLNDNVNKIEICKGCNSRDTFEWIKIV